MYREKPEKLGDISKKKKDKGKEKKGRKNVSCIYNKSCRYQIYESRQARAHLNWRHEIFMRQKIPATYLVGSDVFSVSRVT